MSHSATVLTIAIGYLVACLVVGMWPSNKSSSTSDGYVAGDRSLGLFVMYFITGATIFSAFAFLGMPGRAFSRGAAAFYILGFGTLGFLPFYFLAPRAARVGRRYGFVTQAEMVARRFQTPLIATLMALISLVAFIPYLSLQMKGAGYVLNAMSQGGISEEWGALLVYGVVLTYVLKSGVLGVGWTNTFQGIFMMLLAWGLGLYVPHALYGGVGAMFERIATERPELLRAPGLGGEGTTQSWSEYSSQVIVSMIGFSFWPHLFMKAFTAKDDRTLRRTVVLYPTFQIFLVPILIIGFAGVLFESAPDASDQILPHLLMNMDLPSVLVGLFCAGALAASMSSGDAILHAAASIAVRDGAVTGFRVRLGEQSQRNWIRILLPIILAASYTLAFAFKGFSIVGLLLFAYGPVTQLAPAVVAALYSKRASGAGVLAGLATGIAVSSWISATGQPLPSMPLHAGLYGLIANVLVLVLVSALKPGRASSEEFLAIARNDHPAGQDTHLTR